MFFLPQEKDRPFPVCLGIVHALRGLAQPYVCAFCQTHKNVWSSMTLFSLNRPNCSQSDSEGEVSDGEVIASWIDQMEELCQLQLAPWSLQSQQHAKQAPGDEEDIFDLGIDKHCLSNKKQNCSS